MKKRFFLVGIFTMLLLCCGFLNAAVKKRDSVSTNLNGTSWKMDGIPVFQKKQMLLLIS